MWGAAAGAQHRGEETEMLWTIVGWIVFGLIVGFIARALVPGRDAIGVLRTIALGERLSGAIAGKHQVVVVPAGKPGDIPPAIELKDVTVESKDNEFTISLPAKPK